LVHDFNNWLNGSIPLQDELIEDSKLENGDILRCTITKDKHSIKPEISENQRLSDEQIEAHSLLTRLKELNTKYFENSFSKGLQLSLLL
jgi:hypothetical protein